MTRRKFCREFKIEVVRLVTDRGVAVAQAARDLDMAESVFRRWIRELTSDESLVSIKRCQIVRQAPRKR